MIVCLAVRSFDRAIFEEYYYDGQQSFRFSTMFFAEVAANLKRLSPLFPCEDEDPDQDEPSTQSRVLQDERRFDMLWIYSVGSYIEKCNAEASISKGPAKVAESMVSSSIAAGETQPVTGAHRPFSARFSRLVRTLGFESFEEVTRLLSGMYFYCARLQDDGLRQLVHSGF